MATERIVIALDLDTGARHALELAATLAALLGRELEALFVQDQDLFNLAALPFVSEIDRLSGVSRRLDPGALEAMLETVELEWRQELNQLARSFNLRWNLRRIRGRYYRVAMEYSSDGAVLVLGRDTLPRQERNSPVCLLCDTPAGDDPACRAAAALARVRQSPLLVIGKGRPDESPESLASPLGLSAAQCRRLSPDEDPGALPGLLDRAGCALLVTRRDTLERYGDLPVLLRRINCPVVLVA